MLLLPVLTGLLLILPGLESSVYNGRNDLDRDPQKFERLIDRLIEEYQKAEINERRRYENKRRPGPDDHFKDEGVYLSPEAKNLEYKNSKLETIDAHIDDDDVNFAAKELEAEGTEDVPANPSNKEEIDEEEVVKNDTSVAHSPIPPQRHTGEHKEGRTGIVQNDFMFIFIVAACSIAGLVGLIMAGVCWYKLHRHVKAASDVDYPAYGVTGPTKERSPSQGDRKLAQSAQMYHYQHQKQQMIAMEKANGEMKPDASEDESEEENEEGDYTVYECPGLAPTGEMEVRNPLFTEDAQTPVNGQPGVGNGTPEKKQ